jgi:RNA polymerase sigma-70 factor (ECF subfamily)
MCVVREQLPEMLEKIRPYAIRLAGKQDADDLLQQTAFLALRSAHQFQEGTNLANWLYKILRNQFLTDCRKSKRRSVTPVDELPTEFITLNETATTSVFAAEVRTAIADLADSQADVIRAICNDEMTYDETALRVGTSVGTVKSRLWRGRMALRRRLQLEAV